MTATYRYYLALSSQFPFCGIPLRLDSYSRCQFACQYCFASARGGAAGEGRIQFADPRRLARRMERLARGAEPASVLDEMLAARVPIHFGGMSDPFMPIEAQRGVTLDLLRVLAEFAYPTILSTKGVLAREEPYLSLLAAPNFAVQFSITSTDDGLSRKIDAGAPSVSDRFRALTRLAGSGVKVAVRHQPLLPGREAEAFEVLGRAIEAGARHYAVEYLKLPLENDWHLRKTLSGILGLDLAEYYASRGAARVGREWVLPVGDRLKAVLSLRSAARAGGISFGAADNDLLHASDGNVCCSGADLLGLGDGMQFNFLSAVRGGLNGGDINFASIAMNWRPQRPISEYVNSRSREPNESVSSFVRSRWNGVANGPSPSTFYGVEDTGALDGDRLKIYRISEAVRHQLSGARLVTPSRDGGSKTPAIAAD